MFYCTNSKSECIPCIVHWLHQFNNQVLINEITIEDLIRHKPYPKKIYLTLYATNSPTI